MNKKIVDSSSNDYTNLASNMESLMNHKFKERLEISPDLHQRILVNTSNKKAGTNFYWYVAAGLAILICLNVFSIRSYNKQMKREQLKEFYSNDWNHTSIY